MDKTIIREHVEKIFKECEEMGYTWDDVDKLLQMLTIKNGEYKSASGKTAFRMYENN